MAETGELLSVQWEEALRPALHKELLSSIMTKLLAKYHGADPELRGPALVSLLTTWVDDPLGPFVEAHDSYCKLRRRLAGKRIKSVEHLVKLLGRLTIGGFTLALGRLALDASIPRHVRLALQSLDVEAIAEIAEETCSGGCFRGSG
jgi:hypothetical protein